MTEQVAADGGDGISSGGRGRRGGLERTLGLREAMTIGVGTMVGAGIFVFPGLAVGQAGPAAALSFGLGCGVALLVALPTSELATAMPRSGGGYYFVSRALGAAAGSLVGLGQWLGLVFASAFYLAGFGHYMTDVLQQLGVTATPSPGVAGLGAAVFLTGMSIIGTRTSGTLQNVVVSLLLALLAVVLGWGVVRILGPSTGASLPADLAPRGVLPIFTTAALVFTSYLGFVQIANVAGEVRDPSRTLPRAMIGSVVLVGLLYVATILVSVSVLGTEAMGETGETAMTEVGRRLLGTSGSLLVGGAGLLATLSSANASILSSSRAVFALGRDGMIPDAASVISRRFRTPHRSILLAGVPVGVLTLVGPLEVLAEVASILHLLLYGLICVSVVVLRRGGSLWYRPTFRAPASPFLPVLGAVSCFGMVGLMSGRALLWSGTVLLAAGGWYVVYGRNIHLRGLEELEPSPEAVPATLLLQVELPDPPGIPDPLIRALSPEKVVLLGWTRVPEQSDPEQVRDELGDEAEETLDAVAGRLRELGLEVDTELVFTGDVVQTLDRVAEDRKSDAILSLRPIERLERIVVVVDALEEAKQAAGFAARICRASGAVVEVLVPEKLSAPEEGSEENEEETGKADEDGETMARIRRIFRSAGMRTDELTLRHVGGRRLDVRDVLEAAEASDLLVVGAQAGEDTFAGPRERITRKAEMPVFLVRSGAVSRNGS